MYVDYAFYRDTYGGREIGEEDFPSGERKAAGYLDAITFQRLRDCPMLVTNDVKMAVCAVMEEKQRQDKVRKEGRVSSFNNDGYTESLSYGNDSRSDPRKLREAAAIYLANTGLLYRGCYHAYGHGNHNRLPPTEG